MEWKLGISAAKPSNEVIFEGLDCAFSGVATVDAGRSKLVLNAVVKEEVLEYVGAFIVKALELRPKSSAYKFVIAGSKSREDGFRCAIWHWDCIDVVAVIVVEDKHVVVAGARRYDEASRLVSEDLSCW